MPRYVLQWPDVPRQDRDSYPASARRQLDQRIEELLEDPTSRPARYHPPPRDYWITLFGANNEGMIMYIVREEPIPVVTILRLTYLAL